MYLDIQIRKLNVFLALFSGKEKFIEKVQNIAQANQNKFRTYENETGKL